MTNNKHLVSIVIPVYNAARFLHETVKTIQDQTYTNWEAIFIDDCSTDNSTTIIENYMKKDVRLKLLRNKTNSYAAITRNKGIQAAKGRYIAFLDADDLWVPEKLEKQVAFMQEKDCSFSFTGYEFADEHGKPNGKKVRIPDTITYKQALKNTTISTTTVMLDVGALSKNNILMPNLRRGQDTATWWKILKTINCAHGINDVLAYYRRTNNTLSSNKLVALKRTWFLYRKVESITWLKSVYYFVFYLFRATLRRL